MAFGVNKRNRNDSELGHFQQRRKKPLRTTYGISDCQRKPPRIQGIYSRMSVEV
jgi:hypothetical protein